ncbi:hypothetical protein HELRODRAFT_171057 [Helobdella robusta]|uniref:Uncharacterized protein n=1 Tax=Helobdella robusta TaxID=6412 RepID=T1F3R9_HELRO|nr:hypothetical protein HELRODRAFT_171057 [Helobdella robusta]ESO07019.1 hypothetical protein HELRODRAFT_171057 [Helobdella robusta]
MSGPHASTATVATDNILRMDAIKQSIWEKSKNKFLDQSVPLLIALDVLELAQFCKLAQCIREQDRKGIDRLLLHGVDNLINYVHPYDDIGTTLGIAADRNDESMVTYLLERGANPNVVDLKGRNAATRACEFGHVESLKLLIEAGTNMATDDDLGNGLVYYCIGSSKRHVVCAGMCIENGAPINKYNKQGLPAFVAHCENAANNEELCLLLLSYGANPNLQDLNTRRTAIMAASAAGSLKVAKTILEIGINNINETMDKTKLHAVHEAAKAGSIELLILLSAFGADFNQQTSHAYCHALTPLHCAASSDKNMCCLFAGQRGANGLLKNRGGLTPFQLAKKKGFKLTAKACKQVEKFAPRKKRKPRNPPLWVIKLHDFLYYRENEVLEEFTKYDVEGTGTIALENFWTVANQFKFPFPEDEVEKVKELIRRHFSGENNVLYVKFILGKEYIPKKFQLTKYAKKIKKMKKLKALRGKPVLPICKIPDSHRRFEFVKVHQDLHDPLRFDRDRVPTNFFTDDSYWYLNKPEPKSINMTASIRKGDINTIEDAFESQEYDVNGRDKFYRTPLMIAILNSDINLVKILVSKGAYVNVRDNFLWTPLHLACHVGNIDIVQFLLQKGAKTDNTSMNKSTPLMKAVESKSLNIVKSLIAARAKIDAVNRKEYGVMELAAAFADYYIFNYLKDVPRPAEKKKLMKTSKKIKINLPPMSFPEENKDVFPPDPIIPERCIPTIPYRHMIEMTSSKPINDSIDEKLVYRSLNVWTRQKTTEEIISEKNERRRRLGWRVDFEGFRLPFLQNIQEKVEAIEKEENSKIERPILKKKQPKAANDTTKRASTKRYVKPKGKK